MHINILALIKKTISIFLIVLLGLNSFGLSFFYWAEIQLCKIKAEENSDDDQKIAGKSLILFSSDTKGVELVNKKEILAGGKMYDIVKTQISNGKTLYYALADNDEDGYVRNLTVIEKNSSGEKSVPGKTIKLDGEKYFTLEKLYHSICLSLDLPPDAGAGNKAFFCPSPLKDVISPPPDHLSS